MEMLFMKFAPRTDNANSNDRDGITHRLFSNAISANGLTHLVYTYDLNERKGILYHNGNEEVIQEQLEWNFDSWDDTYQLAFGWEFDEDDEQRAWLGELYLVAVYGRSLSPAEVEQNFYAGRP
jgi:hypothetical protein